MTLLVALLLAQATAADPCIADAHKYCAGMKPGEGRLAECFKEHKADMSAECKAHMEKFRGDADACEADVQKLCPDTKPGPARHQCMMEHKDQVSEQCKELYHHVMEHRGDARQAMRACAPDAEKLCKDTQPGGGRVIECLKAHQSELAPACQQAMSAH
jgi:hypothetical protein